MQNRGGTPEILHILIIPMDQIIIEYLEFKQNIDIEHTQFWKYGLGLFLNSLLEVSDL